MLSCYWGKQPPRVPTMGLPAPHAKLGASVFTCVVGLRYIQGYRNYGNITMHNVTQRCDNLIGW